MNSIHLTSATTISDLKYLLDKAGNNGQAKIRAKEKDGQMTLYVKTESKGTGLKNFLFGTNRRRSDRAKLEIQKIAGKLGNAGVSLLREVSVFDSRNLIVGDIRHGINIASAAAIRSSLPEGAQMDDLGNLSGTQYFETVPTKYGVERSNLALNYYVNQNIADVMSELRSASIQQTTKSIKINGLWFSSLAARDIPRMNYNITSKDGTTKNFKKLPPGSDEKAAKEHAENFASALHELTGGNDVATQILSFACEQTTITPLTTCLRNSNGEFNPNFDFVKKHDEKVTERSLIEKDGTMRSITPKQMGGAIWTLSDDGKNFKISIDWPFHYQAGEGYESLLPLHQHGVVQVDYHAEFLIGKDDANKGQFKLSLAKPISATFSGRLKLD